MAPSLAEMRDRFSKGAAEQRAQEEAERRAREAAEAKRKREEQEKKDRERKAAAEAEAKRQRAKRAAEEARRAKLHEDMMKEAARPGRGRADLRDDEYEVEFDHLEYRRRGSRKFWMGAVINDGARGIYGFVRRWGRIGTTGQGKWVDFVTAGHAIENAGKVMDEKLGKGYSRVGTVRCAVRLDPSGAISWRPLR